MAMGEHDVIDRLRAVKPIALMVVTTDGTATRVAVPAKGQRWSRAWAVIAKLEWTEIRALNKAGEVLDVIVKDPQAMEDLSTPPRGDGATAMASLFSAHTVSMVRALGEAMRSAREQAGSEMADILTAHRDLMRDAFTLRAETLEENAQLRAELERMRIELATSSGDGSSANAREAMLMNLLGSGDKPTAKPSPTPPKDKPPAS